MKHKIHFAFIFLILFGCQKKYASIEHGFFTFEYKNAAWGQQYKGWMINSEGKVLSFESPQKWNKVDSNGYITPALLEENINSCDSELEKVSKRKMYKYNKLISGASIGSYSEKSNTAYDLGTSTYSCYTFDKEKGQYKKVILAVEGDFSYKNTSSEAEKIMNWLKEID